MAAFRYDIATTVPPDDDDESDEAIEHYHQQHPKRVRKRGSHNHNKIETLPKEVVDRIAAGEVIQRPVNVVKELIENSLDADSTHIEVQVTAGGLRLLSVTDDGIGIHPHDLALAATRFATSKLCAFDDLKSIRTFGFRGEALASASMVARLSISSKLRFCGDSMGGYSTSCAYKQSYRDSHPVSPKPTPSAGKHGTVVRVEDLFYNIPSRRRAFIGSKKEKEEYNRVLDVTQKYAIHQSGRGVAFVCRKSGGVKGGGGIGSNDLNTLSIPSLKILMERRRHLQKKKEDENQGKERVIDEVKNWATPQERDQAMRDVIGHVYGSNVARELLTFECGEGDIEAVSIAALKFLTYGSEGMSDSEDEDDNKDEIKKKRKESSKRRDMAIDEMMLESTMQQYNTQCSSDTSNSKETKDKPTSPTNKKPSKFSFTYRAHGLLSNSSYSPPKSSSTFILFLNDRLVECPPLKRTIESIYADSLPKGSKPFVYLSLELPGPHVDVNVHPTKREVAFLHEDRLCAALATEIRRVLGGASSSRTFYAQALLPKGTTEVEKVQQDEDEKMQNGGVKNIGQRSSRLVRSSSGGLGGDVATAQDNMPQEVDDDDDDSDDEDFVDKKRKASSSSYSSSFTPEKKQKSLTSSEPTPPKSSSAKKDPRKLVRTNRAAPAGALEPFLVKTQSQSSQQSQTANDEESSSAAATLSNGVASGNASTSILQHAPDCEYFQSNKRVDLSVPGAFATSLCRCQIERGHTLPPLPPSDTIVRPKRIPPTECSYSSVQNLREDLENRAHSGLATKLRDSTFVGCVSRHRSLVQWGVELLMIDHYELARELFYQLALSRFGERENMATFGGGVIDVKVAIERALLFDDDGDDDNGDAPQSQSESPNQTNMELAEQATKCLAEQSEMLKEYFSIQLEWQKPQPNSGVQKEGERALMLTGLPILLEGHSPAPHGLPIFLLRLATEVDWTEEKPCFEGVCTELGAYYAEIPFQDDERDTTDTGEGKSNKNSAELVDAVARRHVQHTLFPAISFLLVPPKEFASDGTVVKLALLTSLYKVFERC